MNANVSKLLNEQINKEFYSAYLYLDFANYYAAVGLDGFENWYRVQAQEERDHAMLFPFSIGVVLLIFSAVRRWQCRAQPHPQ